MVAPRRRARRPRRRHQGGDAALRRARVRRHRAAGHRRRGGGQQARGAPPLPLQGALRHGGARRHPRALAGARSRACSSRRRRARSASSAVFGELHRFFAADPRSRPRRPARGARPPGRGAEAARAARCARGSRPSPGTSARGRRRGRHYADVDPEAYVVHMLQLVDRGDRGVGGHVARRSSRASTRARAPATTASSPASRARACFPTRRRDRDRDPRARARRRTAQGETRPMASYFSDNDDLRFYFDRGIDWASLVEVTEYGFRTPDGFKTAAEARRRSTARSRSWWASSRPRRSPRAPAQIDREGSHLEAARRSPSPAMTAVFERIKAAELHRLCLPRELGGLNAPLLALLPQRRDARARRRLGHDPPLVPRRHGHGDAGLSPSTRARPRSTSSTRAHRQAPASPRAIDEIARGEAWGCMDITEPERRQRHGRAPHARPSRTRRQLVRHRAEDLHHLRPRQVPLRHRPHRGAPAAANDPFAGLGGLSMFLVKTLRRPARRHAQALRHDRAGRGEARPPRLGHGGALLRARAGASSSASAARASSTC